MKKLMCLALAVCMVFVLAGVVVAEELTAQIVYPYENENVDVEVLDKTIFGSRWIIEFVENAGACDLNDETACDDDWGFVQSKQCRPGPFRTDESFEVLGGDGKPQQCWDFNCMCCDKPSRKQGMFGRPFSLVFSENIGFDCGNRGPDNHNSLYWADFVNKVTLELDCEYMFGQCKEDGADFQERFFNSEFWDDYFDTAPYPECLPCDVEILYCQYIDTICVEDDDDGCGKGCGCPGGDDCVEKTLCAWFHPDLEFTRENDSATRPTFSEVIYGGNLICPDHHPKDGQYVDALPSLLGHGGPHPHDPFNRAGESSFVTRFKWYDYEVTTCDECEGEGDVVLWNSRRPMCGCGDNERECNSEPECIPICEDEPVYQFVRYFTMDLYNCDNITAIDLDFPVCCPCDPDVEWGVWKFVEVDECAEYCMWEPMDVTYNESCETPVCGDEECECTLSMSLTGSCGTDECNPGELCDLEDEVFALGWFVPAIVEGVFGSTEYSVKAYPCNPMELVKADLAELEVPEGASEDGLYFEMVFDPANADGICKVKICMDPLDGGDFSLFTFNEDTGYWVGATQDDEGCFVFQGDLKALLGMTLGAGDPADFPTGPVVPPTDDDDDDDNGTPGGETPTTSSSSGGCNVGAGAAILLLLVPLGALWFRKF